MDLFWIAKNEVKDEANETDRPTNFEEVKLNRIEHECNLFSENLDAECLVRCVTLGSSDEDSFICLSYRGNFKRRENILKKADIKKVHYVRNRREKLNKAFTKCKKKFACDVCHLEVFNLKSHMLTHTKQTPYKCEICFQEFSHKTSLKRHIFSHSGERPYECSFCEKRFIEPYQLKLHTSYHTDKKVFKCTSCGKQYITKESLKSHIANTHCDQRKFKCDVCKKDFKRKEHLKRHTLIHTGEKSFACAECTKTFRTKWHLQRHIAIHEAKEKS